MHESIEKIQKGERIINEACSHLNETLKNLIEDKRKIYQKLTIGTSQMKEKIISFDEINTEYHALLILLKEKEEFLSSDKRMSKIKNTISMIKVYYIYII